MRLCPDALPLACDWKARPPIMAMTAIFDSANKTRLSAPPNFPPLWRLLNGRRVLTHAKCQSNDRKFSGSRPAAL